MLAKVGYGKNEAGGLLAAGGLGAIISPPVLGAAAFLSAVQLWSAEAWHGMPQAN
jgi:TRAP-type uncharacterized transport system fused permease subunit